jgi:hypothetical protein
MEQAHAGVCLPRPANGGEFVGGIAVDVLLPVGIPAPGGIRVRIAAGTIAAVDTLFSAIAPRSTVGVGTAKVDGAIPAKDKLLCIAQESVLS